MKATNYLCSILALFIVMILSSCAANQFTYQPKLNLDASPLTIHKTVRIEKFRDNTPDKDRRNPFAGISVTNEKYLDGKLDIEVTKAIATDFTLNEVFTEVSRNAENPDYIIRGEIKRYNGVFKRNNFAKISPLVGFTFIAATIVTQNPVYLALGFVPIIYPLLGFPMSKNHTEIEIVLYIYDKDNELIGTYMGNAFSNSSTNLRNSSALFVTKQMNETFEDVVMQIRYQILRGFALSAKSNR